MNPQVKELFAAYPALARAQLMAVRAAVFSVAASDQLGAITETLKWGEPSYSCSGGSPIRMAWKARGPSQVALFFNCKTSLLDTFKEIYPTTFNYGGNREIVFFTTQSIPMEALINCLSMALRYHRIKRLPLLGAA